MTRKRILGNLGERWLNCCALFPQDPPGSVNIDPGYCMVLGPLDALGPQSPQSQHCRSWSGHVMLHKVKWELYRGGSAAASAASAKFGIVMLAMSCL